MKKLKFIFLSVVALLLTLNVAIAQNYKAQFKVNASGEVNNSEGVKLGWIENDGTIKNSKGEAIGKIVKKDKTTQVLDKLGNKIAEASENGTLKDNKGTVLFTISEPDENGECQIKDQSGKIVGSVHQNYKQQGACLYHCLAGQK